MGVEVVSVTKRRAGARQKGRNAGGPGSDLRGARPLTWRYRAGRLLQFLGLLVLPFGIASELMGKVGLGQSLLIAGGGALVFYAGFVIQHGETAAMSGVGPNR
jgi:hypothetical protein